MDRRPPLLTGASATARRGRARPLIAAAVSVPVTAAALVLAGCGGGGGGPDLTMGLSAEQILAQSITRAHKLSSYTLSLDLTSSGTAAPGAPAPSGLAALLVHGFSLSGAGPVRPSDASLDLTARPGTLRVQLNLTKLADRLYVSLAGSTVRVAVPAGEMATVNLDSIRTAPLTWLADPKQVGRESIDGVTTVHLTGRLSAARAGGDLLAALRALNALGLGGPLTPATAARSERQLGAALRAADLGIWVGTQDLQTRRVVANLRLRGRVDALAGVSSAAIDLSTDVTGLNAARAITAPSTTGTVKPSDLSSLLGG